MLHPTSKDQEREQLFLSLIDDHKGILYKVSQLYCQDPEDRRDLIQEITIQLWKSFGSYDETKRWSTWMYRTALNVAISYYRKESRRISSSSPLTDDILDIDHFEKKHELNEQINHLYAFINQLKKFDRALILLYLDNLSYQDIADILGITKTNVATKISRIKTLLKRHISTEIER